jgi:hypothetical protein
MTCTELMDDKYFQSVDDLHDHLLSASWSYERLVPGDYKFLDYNADGLLNTADLYPVKGSFYPPLTASISTGLAFKGFNLSLLFTGVTGKYINTYEYMEYAFRDGDWRMREVNLDYWTPTHHDATNQSPALNSLTYDKLSWLNRGGIVDRLWRKSDYIRLKELYLGYNLNEALTKRIFKISGIQLYFSGYNLLTLTNLKNKEVDPETTRAQDFNSGFYPQTSTKKIGVKITF